MARFCPYCGAKRGEDARFCRECGRALPPSQERPTQNAAPRQNAPDRPPYAAPDRPRDPYPQPGQDRMNRSAGGERRSFTAPPTVPTVGHTGPTRASAGRAAAPSQPKSRRGLAFFLALVMVGTFLFTGYKYPGFLIKEKDEVLYSTFPFNPLEGSGGTSGGSSDGGDAYAALFDEEGGLKAPITAAVGLSRESRASENAAYTILKDNELSETCRQLSPGNAAMIAIRPDKNKVMATPPVSSAVTKDNPVAVAGNVTVDFGKWNIEEDDAFEFRQLGTVTDANDGYSYVMYDFSMASGRDSFPTLVTATIPRTAGEHRGRIARYNESEGVWEPVSARVSEDGSHYTVYLDHFCGVTEQIDPNAVADNPNTQKAVEGLSDQLVSLLTPDGSTSYAGRDCLSIFEEEPVSAKHPMLMQRVTIREDLSLADFVMDCDFREQLLKGGKIDRKFTDRGVLAVLGKVLNATEDLSALSDFGSLGGVEVIPGGIMDVLSGLGILYTFANLCAEYEQDPKNMSKILTEEKWLETSSMIASVAGMIGSLAGLTVLPAAMTAIGLVYYAVPKTTQVIDDHEVRSAEECVYRNFLIDHATLGGAPVNLYGYGWSAYLNRIIEDADMKDDPAITYKAITESIEHFLTDFWKLDFTHKTKLRQDTVAKLSTSPFWLPYENDLKKGWDEPKPYYRDEYILTAREVLYRNLEDVLREVSKKYNRRLDDEIKSMIATQVLPILNMNMQFVLILSHGERPKDDFKLSEESGWYTKRGEYAFDECYPYSFPPERRIEEYNWHTAQIAFEFNKPVPLFAPSNTADDYGWWSFIPHPGDDYHTIFQCTFYHYLMMGAPSTLRLHGEPERAEAIDFVIPEFNIKYGSVTVRIEEDLKDLKLEDFCGFWYGSSEEPFGFQIGLSIEYHEFIDSVSVHFNNMEDYWEHYDDEDSEDYLWLTFQSYSVRGDRLLLSKEDLSETASMTIKYKTDSKGRRYLVPILTGGGYTGESLGMFFDEDPLYVDDEDGD